MLAMAMPRDAERSMIELIASTPAVKEALRERDAAVTAERSMLISDLRRLEATAAVETPKLVAAEEETAAKLQKAEAATRAAQLMHIKALAARQSFAFDFGREHDRIETELRATASPLIAAFVAEMNAAWDKTRREPLSS
jgi:hypothetical protein